MVMIVERLSKDVAELAGVALWPLSDAEVVQSLTALHRAGQALLAVQLQLIHQAEIRGLPAEQRFRTMTSYLRTVLSMDPSPARELAEQSRLLDSRPDVAQAVVDGHADIRQAAVIASAVEQIPETIAAVDGTLSSREIADKAERMLIGMAGDFPAYQLRQLGQRILDHVAPEIAERAEEVALQQREARTRNQRGFTLSSPVDGLVRLSGALSAEDAMIINTALQPLCCPAKGDDRTVAQLRADALVEVCRLAMRTGDLPVHGGEPPQLAVTTAFDTLAGQMRAGTLDSGERISAETVRRLACDARILPLVLGSAGQILNAGRRQRAASGPLRQAVLVRDGGCAFPGCDRPRRWADLHHVIHWSRGGTTDALNLVALCGFHHRVIHDPSSGWRVRMGADQIPDFFAPPWLDPEQKPQRNRLRSSA
ncbi:HNH endonuclease signature motif containing protein [Actinoplanes sp. TFC3]|uniref:HNH endonuclease signature motif containing protein n=1 Tax=Actinoplanes sp. TFC3 TaxID=1710355 RepID=UPI0009EB79EB|nr:HNH endonuclease signature motif containing protein [Actinoplanes sp. TFC3]